MNPEIAFIYKKSATGEILSHPVHQEWAKSMGATSTGIRQFRSPGPIRKTFIQDVVSAVTDSVDTNSDVFVFEEPATLYYSPLLRKTHPDATQLYLETNWRRYPQARDGEGRSPISNLKRWNNYLDARLLDHIIEREIDGFVTVSQMVRESLLVDFGKPTAVVSPYVKDDVSRHLRRCEPDYDTSRACVVCKNRYHKGVDRLVDAWSVVRNEIPDAELRIVGSDHPQSYARQPGIETTGYVDDLREVFSNCSVYVHPARFDACPVSVLEAMYAGLPTIVTDTTGTKEFVESVDESLICGSSTTDIAEAVADLFRRDSWDRASLGTDAREAVRGQTESHSIERFNSKVKDLIRRVDHSSKRSTTR